MSFRGRGSRPEPLALPSGAGLSPTSQGSTLPMNIPPLLERLAYRYPSLLVDAVTEHDPGRRMVAVKNVTVSEEFFQGHFPGTPLMPGVLMIETLAQVATILLTQSGDGAASRAHLR